VEVDGQREVRYHYHFTMEFPYTVGCLAGSVDPALLQRRALPPSSKPKPEPPKPF
jgi:hypothetical protein